MATIYQIFKGGFPKGDDTNRLAPNQRPADGHLKAGMWEDYTRINKDTVKKAFCGELPKLEIGDVIQIHTTLTFGVIDSLGIAMFTGESGLKLKPVFSDSTVSMADIKIQSHIPKVGGGFEKLGDEFSADGLDAIFGDREFYAAGYADPSKLMRVVNAVAIGLEVLELPKDGLKWDFDIETRLHMRQSVRPPACMDCCQRDEPTVLGFPAPTPPATGG